MKVLAYLGEPLAISSRSLDISNIGIEYNTVSLRGVEYSVASFQIDLRLFTNNELERMSDTVLVELGRHIIKNSSLSKYFTYQIDQMEFSRVFSVFSAERKIRYYLRVREKQMEPIEAWINHQESIN